MEAYKICGVSHHVKPLWRKLAFSDRGLAVKKLLYVLILAFPLFAQAQNSEDSLLDDFGLYVGAGIGFISTGANDAFDGPVSFKVGEVLGGARWRWIGVEFRKGQSIEDEVIDVGQNPNTGSFITARTAISSYETAFLRLQLENEIARIYFLIGETLAQSTSTYSEPIDEDGLPLTNVDENGDFFLDLEEGQVPITIVDATVSGLAYGAGVGIEVNERLFFNLEYKSLYESDELSLPMVGATIDFHIF